MKTQKKINRFVTLGWDLKPTVLTVDGFVYPRRAEMIFHKEFYPTGKPGEWPCNPETGEKLPITPDK